MPGLESDSRAGAVRVDPDSITAKPADLTPNIELLSRAVHEGIVQTTDILDRFSAKNIAQDEAATATARLQTRTAQEVGPLAIEAKKASLNPAIVQGEQELRIGEIDQKLADLDALKKTRKQRDKIFQAQVGQALDEITQHLPASSVAQLNNQFPQLGAQFDEQGRVTNADQVRARMPDILAYQKFLDSAGDLTSQFETRQVEFRGGAKGLQTFWKGTNRPVPPAIVNAATGAKEARFGAGFSENGNVPEPGQFVGAHIASALEGTSAGPESPQAQLSEKRDVPPAGGSFRPQPLNQGDITSEGVFITGEQADARGKPTEIQARGAKFYRRMALAEEQYTSLLETGFDPAGTNNNVMKDLIVATKGVPVLRTLVSAATPEPVIEYEQVLQNFTSSVLRDESGAAVRDEERAEYERMFFPIAGESELTSANKARQRASAAAALKAVAEGDLSEENYERLIEGMTGRQFPAATSVRSVSELGSASSEGNGPIIGDGQVQTPPSPSAGKIESFKPGKPIPANVDWIKVDGRILRRKRKSAAPSAPAPQPAPQAAPPVPTASASPNAITPRRSLTDLPPSLIGPDRPRATAAIRG